LLNVKTNLDGLSDQAYAGGVRTEARALQQSSMELAAAVRALYDRHLEF
jgi:formiminotetrahydrofolate cyclodeaminase